MVWQSPRRHYLPFFLKWTHAPATLVWVAGCAGLCGNATHVEQQAGAHLFPSHWWTPVPQEQAASWEILPQEAGPGEVILSKRNELGLLSNFAHAPFVLYGHRYLSLEGFWQMMKYPEGPTDPRATFSGITWRHTREEVSQMIGVDAKAAGKLASDNMRVMGVDWVTSEGRRMKYWTPAKGEHYDLIVQATWEKVRQNPKVREMLLSTGDLILRPDHHQATDAPPAWRYCRILMDIREALANAIKPLPRHVDQGFQVLPGRQKPCHHDHSIWEIRAI